MSVVLCLSLVGARGLKCFPLYAAVGIRRQIWIKLETTYVRQSALKTSNPTKIDHSYIRTHKMHVFVRTKIPVRLKCHV